MSKVIYTLWYDKLCFILAYEAIDMVTNINNNIQEHYIEHINRYVNTTFNLTQRKDEITHNTTDKIERKELHKALYAELGAVKKDLLTLGEFTSALTYHEWIADQRQKLYGSKTAFDKNNIDYDLKSNTQDYLPALFYIASQLEKCDTAENPIRLFNVLPLRTNIVPKHICIDTCALISNFLGNEPTSSHLKNYKKGDNQEQLWDRFFNLNKRTFRKVGYTFNYMIKTDGVACSVIFVRCNEFGEPIKKPKTIMINDEPPYIERSKLNRDKKIVCADPNYSDLIYCGSRNESGELETFRYTQGQRILEMRSAKYNRIIDYINKNTIIDKKSVKELETHLSQWSSKTVDWDNFTEYLKEKNVLNYILQPHYEQRLFRKLRLNRFINKQKSETKMLKNFSNKFGTPEETIYVMGDYDKGGHDMKGLEPVICKKFRRLFRVAGYETYLINEFRTSKLCNGCHNELEPFLEKRGKICNGLLRCQSVKPECKVIHNRDKNAIQNMLTIVKSVIETGKRPSIFCRSA